MDIRKAIIGAVFINVEIQFFESQTKQIRSNSWASKIKMEMS